MNPYLPKELNPTWGPLRGEWVEEVDSPTCDIDWDMLQRYEECCSTRGSDHIYRGPENTRRLQRQKAALHMRGEEKELAGFTTADAALNQSFSSTIPPLRFMGPQKALTPQQRGGQIYSGSPVEASQMLSKALQLMGALTVGFVELDDNTRKLIYRKEADPGRMIDFEDVAVGSETPQRLVLPKAAKWVVVYSVAMSDLGLAQAPSLLARATTMQAYVRLYTIYNQLHEFIRALGYHSYGATNLNGFAPYVAFGVLAGLGELSRLDCLITPERGPMVRLAALATDLPLAPTKPISFGVSDFCRNCRICAEACPVNSISFETEPAWQVRGPWNNPGHRAYFRDAMACRDYFFKTGSNCGVCFARCPLGQPDSPEFADLITRLRQATPPKKTDNRRDPAGWWKAKNHSPLGL